MNNVRAVKKTQLRWLWIALFVAVVLSVLLATSRNAATYRDRTVTQWLQVPGSALPPEVINAFGLDPIPELLRAIQREPRSFDQAVHWVWRKLPAKAKPHFANHFCVDVRGTSSRAESWLKALGSDANAALPDLIEIALRHSDRFKRASAIHTLGLVGVGNPGALKALIDQLSDSDKLVRDSAATAIATFTTNGAPAVPALMSLVKSESEPFNSLLALGFIGSPARDAVPIIMGRLRESVLQGNVLTALSGIGSGDSATVTALIELIPTVEVGKKVQIVEALLKIGPPARSALPALSKLRDEETNILRLMAAMAIANIEQDLNNAFPVLIEALEGKLARSPSLTIYAPSEQSTLPHFIGLAPQSAAAWYLAEMGSTGKPALPYLEVALVAGDRQTKVLAARAIWRIRGEAVAPPSA